MSEAIGKILICDRCGKEKFLKRIGENVCDGGFTRMDTYEPYSDWNHYGTVGLLCPDCSREWNEMVSNFKLLPKDSEMKKDE